MFGLDDYLASLSSGGSIVVVLLVATLLGLRHATDPDHIAAITTLVASGQEQARRRAAALGAWWGLGHAVTLVVFGVPILLFEAYLPENVQRGAETAVAALIVYLAVRLLVRHRHRHEHGRHQVRSPLAAFGIGLVHGLGGSAGVGVLLLAAIPSTALAVASLVVLALFTGVSMTVVTTGFGATLASRPEAVTSRRTGARSRQPRLRPLVRRRRVEPDAVPVLGYSRRVSEPVCVADFERLAESRLEPGAFGFYAGGSDDERALAGNVAAWERLHLRPRVLVDVSEVTTATRCSARPSRCRFSSRRPPSRGSRIRTPSREWRGRPRRQEP